MNSNSNSRDRDKKYNDKSLKLQQINGFFHLFSSICLPASISLFLSLLLCRYGNGTFDLFKQMKANKLTNEYVYLV